MDQASATPPLNGYTVQSDSSASRFLERMEPLLLQQEARYGLMLGIALAVARQPDFYGKRPPYFATVEDHDGVAAAAAMTPPHGLLVFSEHVDCVPALRAIAHDLVNAGWSLPSVNGPEPVCTHFAALWSEITGVRSEVAIRERTFELRQVIHPVYSPGRLRQAALDDLDLLTQWFMDFNEEARVEVTVPTLDEMRAGVQRRIANAMLYVWEDGETVSLAGTSRPTANSIAIGPVYTPPHLRGKGYASSCVAQLSQLLLDQGRTFCTLFTDLSNPTSNHIYQKIGYRPICDYTVYHFEQ
jgi:predicted GNAT family acetyltransferase